jgi:hypothetical protein
MLRLFLVAPDGWLGRAICAADEQKCFEIIRFRSFQHFREKKLQGILIVQWTTKEIVTEINRYERQPQGLSFIVYCPELVRRTVAENEAIRFALLQFGTVAVFSQRRELPTILSVLCRCRNQFHPLSPPQRDWTQIIYDSLPWKNQQLATRDE